MHCSPNNNSLPPSCFVYSLTIVVPPSTVGSAPQLGHSRVHQLPALLVYNNGVGLIREQGVDLWTE